MKKKIAIRKLNRTLLKKEGTKEVYITGKNVLMPFFDYDDIEKLATSRREDKAKRLFVYKKKINEEKRSTTLTVTRENNEVRLTGFEDFFVTNGVNEVDQIVIECVDTGSDKHYMLDYIKCLNTRVFQSFEVKDSCANYQVSFNKKEIKNSSGTVSVRKTIQLSDISPAIEQYDNAYWLWDDSFNETKWGEILGKEMEIVYIAKSKVVTKTIKILKLNKTFKKILKAKTSSSNKLEYQDKELYSILELKNGEWQVADFDGIRNLELVDEGDRIKICNRDAMSFCIYEGGVIE